LAGEGSELLSQRLLRLMPGMKLAERMRHRAEGGERC
jgi:hypothetical protein